jgi:protein transport protein SEC39
MTDSLPPAKVVLLAVQFAEDADIDSLAALAAQRGSVLGKELLLRILLTCLPESVPPADYVSFLREIDSAEYTSPENHKLDLHAVSGLGDAEATTRVRKLRLLPLAPPNTTVNSTHDPLTLFLVHRAYKIDEDEGLLEHLPALINPFFDRSPQLRIWMVSVVLPWIRRSSEYYSQQRTIQNLNGFEQLPDRVAVDFLLSETGAREEDLRLVGRDLRGLVGPWLQSDTRWRRNREPSPEAQLEGEQVAPNPGWDEVLQWLVRQASTSWRVAVAAVEQWHGPSDVDLGSYGPAPSNEEGHQYMVESYARAALGLANLIPDASTEALTGAYAVVSKVRVLLGAKASPPLHAAASHLSPISGLENVMRTATSRNLTWLRSTPLDSENGLTSPSRITTDLLSGLALSAFLMTRAGAPCSMRRAGELLLLRDEREQKIEAIKMIHAISSHGPKSDDHFWERVRNEILWLRDWGVGEGKESAIYGLFSHVKREILEIEILKALLSNSRKAEDFQHIRMLLLTRRQDLRWPGRCTKSQLSRRCPGDFFRTLSSLQH